MKSTFTDGAADEKTCQQRVFHRGLEQVKMNNKVSLFPQFSKEKVLNYKQ